MKRELCRRVVKLKVPIEAVALAFSDSLRRGETESTSWLVSKSLWIFCLFAGKV